uniref:Transmembrane protein n=1 Tax=Heterorhabditis bacteriophora TaxID=37862 RepID=A0A1I7WKC1_HETBA
MQSSRGINTLGGGPSTSQGFSYIISSYSLLLLIITFALETPNNPSVCPRKTNAPQGPATTPYKHFIGEFFVSNKFEVLLLVNYLIFVSENLMIPGSDLRLHGQQLMKGLSGGNRRIILCCLLVLNRSSYIILTNNFKLKLIFHVILCRWICHVLSSLRRKYKSKFSNGGGSTLSDTSRFVAASAVNPIWLVKTRLQLYHGKIGIFQMVKRGVTASYAGVSETMIQFVIYEHLRSLLLKKMLMRTVPNTAITMGTYELVVYMLHQL